MRMPATGRLHASSDAAIRSRFRIATVPGLTVSPHSLSRGNIARSTMRTRAPARARIVAATAPAGPAPTINTSASAAANHHRAVLRAEPEAVAERGLDGGRPSGVRDEIQVALRIRV